LAFHGRVSVSPLIPYNNELIQRGFTERAGFEGASFAFDDGLLYSGRTEDVPPSYVMLQCIPKDGQMDGREY
jgi:hypothetical protein